MAFKVTEFKGSLAKGGGGARPALFKVAITSSLLPSTLSVNSLLVKAAAIPASNIAPLTVNYAGRAYKWSGLRTFDNWTVTVINDEDFKIRNQMMEWMRLLSGKFDGSRSTEYGHPVSDGKRNEGNATVTQLGTDGAAKQVYKFYNLWPTELGEIAVDWSSDAIQEYTIGFAYDYWGHGSGSSTAVSNVVNAA